ncbi:hypothetical protein TNCV_4068611 [Trichonephila clavipes]|nr:hypothetical protein TNCV_4068611 [Trichonephila clavipes]
MIRVKSVKSVLTLREGEKGLAQFHDTSFDSYENKLEREKHPTLPPSRFHNRLAKQETLDLLSIYLFSSIHSSSGRRGRNGFLARRNNTPEEKALENQTISNVGAEAAAPLVLERVCKQGRDSTPLEHALEVREMLAFGRASCVKNRLRKQ